MSVQGLCNTLLSKSQVQKQWISDERVERFHPLAWSWDEEEQKQYMKFSRKLHTSSHTTACIKASRQPSASSMSADVPVFLIAAYTRRKNCQEYVLNLKNVNEPVLI